MKYNKAQKNEFYVFKNLNSKCQVNKVPTINYLLDSHASYVQCSEKFS